MLEIDGLSVSYGGLAALRGVSLTVAEGQFVAIVGPNGAGKTTLFKAISGTVTPAAGRIAFEGRDLLAIPPPERAHLGIAHVPEGRGTFVRLTVEENLHLGAITRGGKAGIAADVERVFGYFPRLRERYRQQAGTLSGGEQQMLAIGRAMMLRPTLMLLDEPSFGLAPLIVQEVFTILKQMNEREKVSLFLVEQNAALALDLADHAYLLETGRVVMAGPARELREDENIRRAYLGY